MSRPEIVRMIVLTVVATSAMLAFVQTSQPAAAVKWSYLLSRAAEDAAIEMNVVERSTVNRT